MADIYPLLRPLLFTLPAEAAHRLAISALRRGLVPKQPGGVSPMLAVHAVGLHFHSPIGLAAGFDKHGEAADALFAQGFSFVEAGTVTPLPQPGNAKPRLFRLREDEAVINRFGFNSQGAERVLANLRARRAPGILGINIGRNKESADAAADYVSLIERCAPAADYITINISSPNTPALRDLQHGAALDTLLAALTAARDAQAALLGRAVPLLLKLAPDLAERELEEAARAALRWRIDGIIACNTTLSRPESLRSPHAGESGGLSGRPLMARSTETLRRLYRLTEGRMPLIGAGGVASAEDAYAKIRAGATLVQLYSALVYQGFGLVTRIHRELPALLARDGFSQVGDAVGVEA